MTGSRFLRAPRWIGRELYGEPQIVGQLVEAGGEGLSNLVGTYDRPRRFHDEFDLDVEFATDLGHAKVLIGETELRGDLVDGESRGSLQIEVRTTLDEFDEGRANHPHRRNDEQQARRD